MHNSPISKEFYSSITNVLTGKTTTKVELPESLKEAALAAAAELKTLNESIMVAETKRSVLRKHLKEGIAKCGCSLTPEMVVRFDEVVSEASSVKMPTQKSALATPAEVKTKTNPPASSGAASEKMPTQKDALATPAEVAKKTAKPESKSSMGKNTGLASTGKSPAKIGEDVVSELEVGLREFLTQLSEEEVSTLRKIINENR